MVFLDSEALLGAGASGKEWAESADTGFRFGTGAVSQQVNARAKWNVIGGGFQLWAPRGPDYGTIEVRLDGRKRALINLHAEKAVPSEPIWAEAGLPDTFHSVVLEVTNGRAALDCLEVTSGR